MRSIQNIITESKRDKQIDRLITTLTLDLDKEKQTLRKTQKTRTRTNHRHDVGYKTKLQNSKTLTKQNSKTQTQQVLQKLSKNTTKTEINTKCTKQGKSRRVKTLQPTKQNYMVAINNNYKVSKNDDTTNEDKNKQIHPHIKIPNERLKNITKIDKYKKLNSTYTTK